jgi:hypothetical protein
MPQHSGRTSANARSRMAVCSLVDGSQDYRHGTALTDCAVTLMARNLIVGDLFIITTVPGDFVIPDVGRRSRRRRLLGCMILPF